MSEAHESCMSKAHESCMSEAHENCMSEAHENYMSEAHESCMSEAHENYMSEAHEINLMLGFHMTSRPPCWCPQTMKWRPCWCPDPILRELKAIIMLTSSFVFVEKHGCWSREWNPRTNLKTALNKSRKQRNKKMLKTKTKSNFPIPAQAQTQTQNQNGKRYLFSYNQETQLFDIFTYHMNEAWPT